MITALLILVAIYCGLGVAMVSVFLMLEDKPRYTKREIIEAVLLWPRIFRGG